MEDLLKKSPEILIEQLQLSSKLSDLISKATQSHSFNIEKWIIEESPRIRLFGPDSFRYPLRLQQIPPTPSVLYWQDELQDQKVHFLLSLVPEAAQQMGSNKHADLLKKFHNMFWK